MNKKFFTNLALLIFLNLLVKPFWIFGIDRTVQNMVGAEEYGLFFSLFNFSIILNFILDVGINSFNNRNIAQNSRLMSKHFSNLIVLKLLLAGIYAILCVGFALVIGYESRQIYMLLFLILNQILLSLVLYFRSNLGGLHLFKTDSIISVTDRVLLIGICSIILWGKIIDAPFRIEWFVYAQTVAYSITAAIAFFAVLVKSEFLRLRFDLAFSIAILKKSMPFALLSLLMLCYLRMDSVMLERFLPDGKLQAGIFAQSFRIIDAISMFAYLFAGLLLPMFSRMIKQKESVNQLVKFAFLLLIIPVLTIAITSVFFRREIIESLYNSHIQVSTNTFGIIVLSVIPMGASYIFGTLLTANGNLKYINIVAFCGVVFNLILNFILIPQFKAVGAAVANLATQTFIAVSQIIISKKIFKFKIRSSLIWAVGMFIFFVVGAGYLAKQLAFNWLLAFIAVCLLSIDVAFILRLLNLKSIIILLRNKE